MGSLAGVNAQSKTKAQHLYDLNFKVDVTNKMHVDRYNKLDQATQDYMDQQDALALKSKQNSEEQTGDAGCAKSTGAAYNLGVYAGRA